MAILRIDDKPFIIGGTDFNNITGYECSIVLDKTTDNAKVSFSTEKNLTWLDTMQRCCIIHDENKPAFTLEYYTNKNGELAWYHPPTKNCNEFLIGNINKTYQNGLYTYNISLIEPIEILKGVICETLQFTNQIEKKVGNVTYVKDRLNHLTVLEKILKVTPANNEVLDGVYKEYGKALFNKIIIKDREFLASVPFNDDTINESSLYEILMNKFDSDLGRTPVLYFGEEKNQYILDFLRQDGYDKDKKTINDIKNIEVSIESKTLQNYATGVVSNVTNMIPALKDYSISEYVYAIPEVETNDRDLTQFDKNSEKGIWVLKLNHNIKSVEKIEKLNIETEEYFQSYPGTGITDRMVKLIRENINPVALEEKEYNASDLYDTRNVTWYKEGDNVIHLNDFFYDTSKNIFGNLNHIMTAVYKVTYTPLVNLRYDLAEDYQIQVNQVDSQVSSQAFGNYLNEYMKSLNKWDLILQCNYDNYEDVIEVGTRVDDYIITSVGIKNRGLEYTVIYQLNKNHIRKSDSIQAPQNIRKNIAIGLNETKDRMSMFVDKFILGSDVNIQEETNILGIDKELLFSPLLTKEKDISKNPQIAYITFKSTLKRDTGETEKYSVDRLCDITKDYFNNTLLFNLRYNDNAEAGKEKRITNKMIELGAPSEQYPLLYTDYFGEVDNFDVKFLNTSSFKRVEDIEINSLVLAGVVVSDEFKAEVNKTLEVYNQSLSYPATTSITEETLNNPVFKIDNINYYKDMLDIFNYTIGLHIYTDKNIILCKQFYIDNILLNFTANESGNHINKIRAYDVNLTENDLDFATPIEEADIEEAFITDIYGGDTITIRVNKGLMSGHKSIVFYENDKPVMIYNNKDYLVMGDKTEFYIGC